MGFGTKLYVGLLLLGGGAFAGPEAVSRPDRGFGSSDLRRAIRVSVQQYNEAERRLRSGHAKVGDDETQVLARARMTDLRREVIFRDTQTGALSLAAIGSAVFLAFGMRRGLRGRQGPRGVVEVTAEQTVKLQPEALGAAMSNLSQTRSEAIARLRDGPRVRCRECQRPSKWKVLGRVGRRRFVRTGEGTKQDVLAEGWWHRGLPPEPCSKCGSTQVSEG